MLNQVKEAIANNIHDGMLYLYDKTSDYAGLFISNGHLLYVVENIEKISHNSINTESLHLNTNIDIVSFADTNQFRSGRYNILELLPSEDGYHDSELESFINLCSAHSQYLHCQDFMIFFYSLISMFQYPQEQQFKNLVCLYGELLFIEYIYKNHSIDCSDKWHNTGTSSKYDFVFDNYNMEIKTTMSADECITIKHTQIFNHDRNYLVVVQLEENNSGRTLNQLIKDMINDEQYCSNYNFIINVEKEKKRVSPLDAAEKFFSLVELKIYQADEVNPFKSIPDNISDLQYDLDLLSSNSINYSDIM